MKFRSPKPNVQSIYDRHPGPYALSVTRTYGRGDDTKTKWLTRRFPTGSSAHQAVLREFEEEDVLYISVWSESCKYYVTTYNRKDADGYAAEESS